MGRRSDHSREQLREIIISAGHRQMLDVGFARFSAREVAKRVGYSIGTLYNVFGSYDGLILAINGRTLDLWRAHLEARLEAEEDKGDRLTAAINAYFEFAIITPVLDAGGKVSHYVAVKEDITERKQIAQELDEHRQLK